MRQISLPLSARRVACILALVLAAFARPAFTAAQSAPAASAEVDSLVYAAIDLIDAGEIERARALLEECERRFPAVSAFPYERAYIHYQQKEYDKARVILERLVDRTDANDRYFQMLGNVNDILGDSRKATEIYKAGLNRFPRSGPLHLELGVLALGRKDYDAAMNYWETGLELAPEFPSNYYHAGRTFMRTTERGWGLIYGEIFLNLEPATPRSFELRNLLYQTWNLALNTREPDTNANDGRTATSISLFKELAVRVDSTTNQLMMPFQFFLFRSLVIGSLDNAIAGDSVLTVSALHALRSRFVNNWFSDTNTARHFNVELFERWRNLMEMGLFEAYDHLIFYGDATAGEHDAWLAADPLNAQRIQEVAVWLRTNPIGLDPQRAFSRRTLPDMPAPKPGLDAPER